MAMKKLVLATLLCGSVAQLGGCIIVGDDDGDNPPPPPPPDAMEEPQPDASPEPIPSAIVVSWTLLGGEPVDGAQSEVTCPPDGVDIAITADPDPAVADDEDIFLYDCVDGETMPEELPPGTYDLWIELLDAGGGLIAQSDIKEGVVLGVEELLELDFEFSVDRGKFALTWTILESGVESTCANVGADDVSLLLTIANTTEGDDFVFSCEAGEGVTDPMPLTEYVGIVTLLDSGLDPDDPADDDVLGESEPRPNLTLDFGNDFEDLGNFTFDIVN
jgi:hypothetical protein